MNGLFLYDRLAVVIAAVRSVATYVAVSFYLLVTGSIGIVLAISAGFTDLLYIFGHGGVRLGLFLSGIRCRIAGTENIPRSRAVVFCANHESNLDPPILFDVLHPRLHILYKAEIDRIPILGRAFRLGGFVPVERQNRERAMRAIEVGARSLRSGNSFLIFPEGTRNWTPELLPFKKGGFIMALKAQAPIVPVAVRGGRAAMKRGSALIHPATVSVRVGEAIETTGLGLADRDRLIARVREQMATLLAQGPVV